MTPIFGRAYYAAKNLPRSLSMAKPTSCTIRYADFAADPSGSRQRLGI